MASIQAAQTKQNPASERDANAAPTSLARILVALDASDHADRALEEAIRLAGYADGAITGIHAYAAKLHDRRFRQMEGGLPERYREEAEMEKQRDVHDDLITRGLNIISDSYHDVGQRACEEAGRPYRRLSPEGKNYSRIVDAAASGEFDVLALGSLGLGAVSGSLIGTVCERVVRRCPIDALVIRDPGRAIGDGPIVVGMDGSPKAFGALKTALDIGRRLGAEVHAVAAYDPYYHYVAFNKISGVLSDEAGKIFRFKEQEKLHEELIDQGIAKIYQSHLDVSQKIADEEGVELKCELLDGKAFQAINLYLDRVHASLFVMGKTGVHADAGLDIGGNAENLLRTAPCHVWLGQTTYAPPLDVVANETIAWTSEAEERMTRVPETARAMVRMAILRFAQESGHTVITSALIEEATNRFCPHFGGTAEEEEDSAPAWSAEAEAILKQIGDASVAASIRLRAEKRARRAGAPAVATEHVRPFLDEAEAPAPVWGAAALARLSRIPEMVRGSVRRRIEASAREQGLAEITLEVAKAGIAEAGGVAEASPAASAEAGASGCPFANTVDATPSEPIPFEWTAEAEARMERIPEGFMRAMTRQRVEEFARRRDVKTITSELIDEKYAEWGAGSDRQRMSLRWDAKARARIDRIPDFVRGMVILEVERCAREMGKDSVAEEVVDRALGSWESIGLFHSKNEPALYKRSQK